MPKGFTAKDERQVLAIKKSCRDRGGDPTECDRIAFATVNKRRREEGRTMGDLDQFQMNGQILAGVALAGTGTWLLFNNMFCEGVVFKEEDDEKVEDCRALTALGWGLVIVGGFVGWKGRQ
jgi:hypothetical protein